MNYKHSRHYISYEADKWWRENRLDVYGATIIASCMAGVIWLTAMVILAGGK